MTPLRRLVLPALIALLVVAEVSTALVGAGSIRADQRRDAAIAKEKRAVSTYKKDLMPVLLRLYDTVQPLQDTSDAFSVPGPGLAGARDDVLLHTGASAALHLEATALKAVRVPTSQHKAAKAMDLAVTQLIGAADKLAGAARAPGDKTGFVAEFGTAYSLLTTGELDLLTGVQQVFGDRSTVPVPAADRAGAHGRKVGTHGNYVLDADRACGKAAFDEDANVGGKTLANELRALSTSVKIDTTLNAKLKALVPAPADAATVGHTITNLLKAEASTLPPALQSIYAALKASNQEAFLAAERKFDLSLPTLRDLSHAYRSYGATLCADYYDVTDLLAGTKGSGGLST